MFLAAVFLMVAAAPSLAYGDLGRIVAACDIPESGVVRDAIHECDSAGVMRGSGKYFRPDAPATRAHLATVLARIDGYYHQGELPNYNLAQGQNWGAFNYHAMSGELPGYDDIDHVTYYSGNVAWVKQSGVLVYEGPLFLPNQTVGVEEALLAFRSLVYLEGGIDLLSRFDSEVETVFGGRLSYMQWVPSEAERDRAVTRAELAMCAAQMIEVNPYFDMTDSEAEADVAGVLLVNSCNTDGTLFAETSCSIVSPGMVEDVLPRVVHRDVDESRLELNGAGGQRYGGLTTRCPARFALQSEEGKYAIIEVYPTGGEGLAVLYTTIFW